MEDIVKSLFDQKQRAAEAMRTFVTEVEERKEGWSEEENKKFQDMSDDYDALKTRCDGLYEANVDAAKADKQREAFDKIVRDSGPKPEEKHNEPTDEEKLRAFLRGETREANGKIAIEFALPTPEQRIHTKVVAASGGTAVPRLFVPTLYDYLVEASPIRRLARVITTSGGENMDFPKTVSHGTAAIVGEGTALGAVDASFTTLTLGAWKYGKLTQISSELANDNGVDLVGWVAQDSGRSIAMAQGANFSTGTGSNQPTGYGTAFPVGVTGATGGTGVPSVANLIDLYYSVIEPYRNSSSCAFVLRDASAAYIRKLTAASTTPEQWAPSLQAGSPDTLLGKPVYTDPFAAAYGTPAKSISFGDWSTYLIRDAGTVRLEASSEFAFDKDLMTYRAILRTDAGALDTTGSVKHFAGPTT